MIDYFYDIDMIHHNDINCVSEIVTQEDMTYTRSDINQHDMNLKNDIER